MKMKSIASQKVLKRIELKRQNSIESLGLDTRSFHCLLSGGLKSIERLKKKSEEDLLKIKNLGKITLERIKSGLKEKGIVLNIYSSPGEFNNRCQLKISNYQSQIIKLNLTIAFLEKRKKKIRDEIKKLRESLL